MFDGVKSSRQIGLLDLACQLFSIAMSNTAAEPTLNVIVDDLLYLNEPMFQDGIVAQAVDAVAAASVAYYSAAGNAGDQSYEAAFNDSGVITFTLKALVDLQ